MCASKRKGKVRRLAGRGRAGGGLPRLLYSLSPYALEGWEGESSGCVGRVCRRNGMWGLQGARGQLQEGASGDNRPDSHHMQRQCYSRCVLVSRTTTTYAVVLSEGWKGFEVGCKQ